MRFSGFLLLFLFCLLLFKWTYHLNYNLIISLSMDNHIKSAGDQIIFPPAVCFCSHVFISHVKAVKSSVYSAAAIGISLFFLAVVYLEFLWPSNGDLLLITEPCFDDKMRR